MTTYLQKLNQLRRNLTDELEMLERRLGEFNDGLVKNPAYALEWADAAFTVAAKHKVASDVLAWAFPKDGSIAEPTEEQAEKFLAQLASNLREEVLRATSSPARSTSVCSNLMAQELAAAKARLLDRLQQSWKL